jgi:transcriptional regulator with XRE-family HTH domain
MELRKLREAAGLTIERVAEAMECSVSKISRIETGRVRVSPRDVRDLLELFEVRGEPRDKLIQLARDARKAGWSHEYSDVRFVPVFIDFEAAAMAIQNFESLLVPGLLQTNEYARAVLRALHPGLPPQQIERRVELRIARQALLRQAEPPGIWIVLDEAVLRRQVGGPEVMREQLYRLAQASELANITLQVLPFSAGQHAGMDGAFTVLTFPDPADLDVVHLENATGELYLEAAEDVQRYSRLFDHLRAVALGPGNSAELLLKLAKGL